MTAMKVVPVEPTDKMLADFINAVFDDDPTLCSYFHEKKGGLIAALTAGYKAMLSAVEPAPDGLVEPVAYLCNGTRFKLSFSDRGNVSSLAGYKTELAGKWVALVDATDNKHMSALTSRAAVLEEAAKICDAAVERYVKQAKDALDTGNVLLGHRQLVAACLAAEIREAKYAAIRAAKGE